MCIRPFPSYLVPLFQNESSCKTLHMEIRLICMKIYLKGENIFIWMVSLEDSFWHRGIQKWAKRNDIHDSIHIDDC